MIDENSTPGGDAQSPPSPPPEEKKKKKPTPTTVEDWLKKKKVLVADRKPFCERFDLKPDDEITRGKFEKLMKKFKEEQKPPPAPKPARYTPVGCSLKYKRKYLLPGDKSDLADLSSSEIKHLLKAGKIRKV